MSHPADTPAVQHFKKQAKELLRAYQHGDAKAYQYLRDNLPVAKDKRDAELAALDLKLHDMQSATARSFGQPSWTKFVEILRLNKRIPVKVSPEAAPGVVLCGLLELAARHKWTAPLLRQVLQDPDIQAGPDLALNCAIGQEDAVRAAIQANPEAVHHVSKIHPNPQAPKPEDMLLEIPLLVAVTHSCLLDFDEHRPRLHRLARFLLDAGADPNQSVVDGGHPLSSLYGAAGKRHDAELTRMLLEAGADPNDGESLYHSCETTDLTCMQLLLEGGARVEGTNALQHMLDSDRLDGLKLLLKYTKDPDTGRDGIGTPLIWGIRRGRSAAHVKALLDAGADPRIPNKDGLSPYRYAMQCGLAEVAEALREAGAGEELSVEEEFVAACARNDEPAARRLLAAHPGMLQLLSEAQLRQLPELTEAYNFDAVRLMVRLGWPIAVTGGDWAASALNLAVYQGNAELARFLVQHGASWTEKHGHGDNVIGTLSWASRNRGDWPGDWVGCAKVVVEAGFDAASLPEDFARHFSPEVAAFLQSERERAGPGSA